MFHFGQMKCGKVDQFGRLFHVVSDFFHVNFIPLIPLRSYLVLGDSAPPSEEAQLPIRMSLKSVVIAWVRAGLIVLVLINTVAVLRNLMRLVFAPARRPEGAWDAVLNPLYLIVGFLIFFALTYRFSKASWTRALHLGALVGMTEEDLDNHLERLYSSRTKDEPRDDNTD